jgi:hypothetical protein
MGIELWASVWLQKRKNLGNCAIFLNLIFVAPPLHSCWPRPTLGLAPSSYKSTPDFEVCDYTILPSSTGPCRLKIYDAISIQIGIQNSKFKLEFKTSKAPTQDTLLLYLPIVWYLNYCYGKRQKLIQQTPLQAIDDNSRQDEEISKKTIKT